MKIDGSTIPSPQNIKRREAYLLTHADKLPKTYVQAQLLKIAMIRSQKRLRWQTPDTRLKNMDERKKDTAKIFEPVPVKRTLFSRIRNIFKAQRGS